jgi:nicotinate phosphoribosyltransferase
MTVEPYRFGSGLLTDLYELAMAAAYVETGFEASATFELIVRSLPARRNFLIVAGLDQALDFLENLSFTGEEIEYLRGVPVFHHIDNRFFEYLAGFRFRGEVWAMPEGTAFFPGEPILRVTAPIGEAQIAETALLALINFQTMIASKAARVVTAAAGRRVVEFGSRRAHGIESGILAARASYLAGCNGTSNSYAGFRFGIPIFGTQAHSWIMAHEHEDEAFQKFVEVFHGETTLLVDTYDVRAAIERLIAIGCKPRGVRLDSGDLIADSIWARQKLDAAGWSDVGVFASGDLDEDRIASLLAAGAEIEAFGVGTSLSTSSDAPALGVVYKLVEIERKAELRFPAKFSESKLTYPGRKQVLRSTDASGTLSGDLIALESEAVECAPAARPLLRPMMREGKRLAIVPRGKEGLAEARERCARELRSLTPALLSLGPAEPYPVRYSAKLEGLLTQASQRLGIDPREVSRARGHV